MAADLDDARTDDLDVPIAWLSAEHAAEQLVTTACPLWSPGLFQYRTVGYVLALTIYLTDTGDPTRRPDHRTPGRWDSVRAHLRSIDGWASWCQNRLAQPGTTDSLAAQRMARSAWQWLCRSRLLYDSGCPTDRGTGLSLGVELAQRVLHHAVWRA